MADLPFDDVPRVPLCLSSPPPLPPDVDAARAGLLRAGVVPVGVEAEEVLLTGVQHPSALAAVELLLGHRDVHWVGEAPRLLVPRPFLACREREPGRLQLRVGHDSDEHLDDLWHVEDDEAVVVLGLVCTPAGWPRGEPWDVPVHVHLDRPLGDRAVIDGATGRAVPVADVPTWA